MRLNEDTVLVSSVTPAVLVPYKEIHVSTYHRWMQSPELLELTASEPLTIEEEYENMVSWRDDNKKMTFIILDTSVTPQFMAGDVNLYLLNDDEQGRKVAEIEVMIAEMRSRRKGLAKDALMMMMAYATQQLCIHFFVAKVLDYNIPSICLFSRTLNFEEQRRIRAFKEIHYILDARENEIAAVLARTRNSWSLLPFASSVYSKGSHSAGDGKNPVG